MRSEAKRAQVDEAVPGWLTRLILRATPILGAMKGVQIRRNKIQTLRNEIQAGGNKLQIRRNEIQIQNPSVSFSKSSVFKSLRLTHRIPLQIPRQSERCVLARLSSVASVFASGSSGLVKQVKGWRRLIADSVLVRRGGAVCARPVGRGASLRTREPWRPRSIPGLLGRGLRTRERQAIDPTSGKNAPASPRARPGSGLRLADGRQPFMP
jgi:hypothetical protein